MIPVTDDGAESEIDAVEPAATVKLVLVSRKYVSSASCTTTRTRADTGPDVGLCTDTVTVWPDDPTAVAWRAEYSARAGVRTRRAQARQKAFMCFDMEVSFRNEEERKRSPRPRVETEAARAVRVRRERRVR
jgi:hypothetical protein